jgi:hypothetical protein
MSTSSGLTIQNRIRNALARHRRPKIQAAAEIDRLTALERKPAVVVYREWGSNGTYMGLGRGLVPRYVFLAGTDARDEAERILANRPEKFEGYGAYHSSFTPFYLHTIGSSDYRYWTEDEAILNLDGFARLRQREEMERSQHNPKRNARGGGGGRLPQWVYHWLNRFDISHFRDFEAVR